MGFENLDDVRSASAQEVVEGLRGQARCTAAVDTEQVAVNTWIRDSEVFDGVPRPDAAVSPVVGAGRGV
ncbi:hypothetical protein [Streptomyces canus]|uniref:hypothetical protein n=1 Tax=Streptomyces canus TaxID=58343 RepID=UPI0022522FEE|nr:hypothetical protein [Streptomyces canus]MCX4855730.1 hypothetical protein [Streptomyces canus]